MWLVPSLPAYPSVRESECSMKPCASDVSISAGDTAFWVTLSGTPTQRPRSWRGWANRPWSLRLFGATTSPDWTPSLCGDLSESSPLASHVSPTALPGSKPGFRTPEATETVTGQSRTPCESLPSVSPPWSSLRTSLPGFQEDGFDLSEKNYADWVTRSKARSLSLRKRLVRAIDAKESLSWPTPDANAFGSGMSVETQDARVASLKAEFNGQNGNGAGKLLAIECQRWATPLNQDSKRSGNDSTPQDKELLVHEAERWSTPAANDAEKRGNSQVGAMLVSQSANWYTPNTDDRTSKNQERNLGAQVELMGWSTPAASDGQRGTSPYSEAEINRPEGKPMTLSKDVATWATPMAADDGNKVTPATKVGLLPQVAAWPTPNSRDHKGTDLESRNGGCSLSHATQTGEFSHRDRNATGSKSAKPSTRRLNPAFVCWLMGWPWWWTRAAPTNSAAEAMELWRRQQQLLLLNLCGESFRSAA